MYYNEKLMAKYTSLMNFYINDESMFCSLTPPPLPPPHPVVARSLLCRLFAQLVYPSISNNRKAYIDAMMHGEAQHYIFNIRFVFR